MSDIGTVQGLPEGKVLPGPGQKTRWSWMVTTVLGPVAAANASGFITFWMGMGGAGGAWLGGYLYDVTGNYQTGFTTAMIFLVFGAAPFVMVRAIRQT